MSAAHKYLELVQQLVSLENFQAQNVFSFLVESCLSASLSPSHCASLDLVCSNRRPQPPLGRPLSLWCTFILKFVQ